MVTSRGWWDLADHDRFYPEDLPQDWRLSYFANSFRAAWLPAGLWTGADPQTVKQWHDDVPPGFHFAAEQPFGLRQDNGQPLQDNHQQLAPALLEQLLGAKLEAWVEPVDRPAARTISANTGTDANRPLHYQRPQSEQRSDTAPDCSSPECYGLIAPAELHRDLRQARHWLRKMTEHQGRAPSLVILARPSSNDLSAWQALIELLGLG
jgi:hypothetical protein